MLSPKRVKFRKSHKLISRKNLRQFEVCQSGVFLFAQKDGWLTARNLESARRNISRVIKRQGHLTICCFPSFPVTSKSLGTRMGKGKGSHHYWVAKISKGNPIFQIIGVKPSIAKKAFLTAASKLPIPTVVKVFFNK